MRGDSQFLWGKGASDVLLLEIDRTKFSTCSDKIRAMQSILFCREIAAGKFNVCGSAKIFYIMVEDDLFEC